MLRNAWYTLLQNRWYSLAQNKWYSMLQKTHNEDWKPYVLKPRSSFIETIAPFFRRHGINYPTSSIDAQVRQQQIGKPLRL
uniref:Uncharacterized protein n=1 Tax=Chlorobium phaeobacteroides (strain BS1) TaxID=331678 RepID=B3EJX1_CHLPB